MPILENTEVSSITVKKNIKTALAVAAVIVVLAAIFALFSLSAYAPQ